MYADRVTGSMKKAIDETSRRRRIQLEYNEANGITPVTVSKSKDSIMQQTQVADSKKSVKKFYVEDEKTNLAADPVVSYMSGEDLNKLITKNQKAMEKAAKDLDFLEAARLRDEILELKKLQNNPKSQITREYHKE